MLRKCLVRSNGPLKDVIGPTTESFLAISQEIRSIASPRMRGEEHSVDPELDAKGDVGAVLGKRSGLMAGDVG